jgi:hypothetical protein
MVMKINQLFNKPVPDDVACRVLHCFGLSGFQDRRMFSKFDMENFGTVHRMSAMVSELTHFYMPCKARTYLLDTPNTKKCVTILKQIIRLYGFTLMSRERNVHGKKVIFYQVMGAGDYEKLRRMTAQDGDYTVDFLG